MKFSVILKISLILLAIKRPASIPKKHPRIPIRTPSKINIFFDCSNLQIKTLNLDDKKRLKALERKGEVKVGGKEEKEKGKVNKGGEEGKKGGEAKQ